MGDYRHNPPYTEDINTHLLFTVSTVNVFIGSTPRCRCCLVSSSTGSDMLALSPFTDAGPS